MPVKAGIRLHGSCFVRLQSLLNQINQAVQFYFTSVSGNGIGQV
jgi:hypothetical protein